MDGMKIALALSDIDDKYKAQADLFARPRRSHGRIAWGVLKGAAGLAGVVLLLGVFLFMAQVQRGMETRGAGNGDLPALVFPAEPGEAENVYSGWPEGALKIPEGWASETLTTGQVLAVFGQSGRTTLTLDGQAYVPGQGDTLGGACFVDRDGNAPYAVIWGQEDNPEDSRKRFTFVLSISREELPIFAAFDTDDATAKNQVFGQTVYTRWFVAPEQEGSEMKRGLQAEFLTGGEEPLGVEIQVYDHEDGDRPGPQSRALMARLVALCLRPGNTFTMKGLTDRMKPATIDQEGRMHYTDSRLQTLYEHAMGLFGPAPRTGAYAGEYAGDARVDRVVNIFLPVLVEEWDTADEQGEPATARLYMLYQRTFLFADYRVGDEGAKMVGEPASDDAYFGAVGTVTTPSGTVQIWRPDHLTAVTRDDLADFVSGGKTDTADRKREEQINELYQKISFYTDGDASENWWAARHDQADELLLSYMEQNGLTDYYRDTYDPSDGVWKAMPFGPQTDGPAPAGEAGSAPEEPDSGEDMEAQLKEAAKSLALAYAKQFWEDPYSQQYPLAECFFENIRVYEAAEDGSALCVGARLVLRPENPQDLERYLIGNAKLGTGDREGYVTSALTLLGTKKEGEPYQIAENGVSTGILHLPYHAGIPEDQVLTVDWPVEGRIPTGEWKPGVA